MSEDDDRGNIDTPRIEIIVLSLAILILCPLVATEPEPGVVAPPSQSLSAPDQSSPDHVLASAITTSTAVDFDVRAALDELPASVGLAFVLPDPARATRRLAAITQALEEASPEWTAERIVARLRAASLLGSATGIDVHGRLTVIPGWGLVPDLVRLALADRERFAAWASGGAPPIATWGEDPVYALALDEHGAACALRGDVAWCQLGAIPVEERRRGTDALEPLRRLIDTPGRRLGHAAALVDAGLRLSGDADVYVFAQPGALVPALSRVLAERAHRATPFATAEALRRLEQDARRRAAGALEAAGIVRSAAAAVSLGSTEMSAQLELELEGRNRLLSNALLGQLDPADPIVRWADTPSLGRLVARVEPSLATEILRLVRVNLPPERVSGTLALMVLGLDTQCPSAKASNRRTAEAWPFVFPMAGAIGLAAGQPLDRAGLASSIDIPRDPHTGVLDDDVLMRGRMFDGPVEARLAPGTILFGTGHGAASAAARRWASPARTATLSDRQFLDARLGLAAIGAALSSGAYDGDTRPELRSLERVVRTLQPLVARYPTAHATAHVGESGARVSVRLTVGP